MARQDLLVQRPDADGAALTYAAAHVDGHRFSGRNAFVHVKNGSGVSTAVTLPSPGVVEELAVADRVITIPAGQDRAFIITDAVRAADGSTDINITPITTVTIAAFGV